MIRTFAVGLALIAGLVACGDDGDDGGDIQPDAASADPCEAARAVADLDDEFQGEINDVMQSMLASTSQEEADAALVELVSRLESFDLDPLLAAYDELESTLDGEPSKAAGTLRTFTADLVEDLRAASSSEEIISMLQDMASDEGALAAGRAALDLDEWSRETCDVVIAD